jgi:putative endonuclease
MVVCADGSIYTGTTNDVQRRVSEHNGDGRGARYTRSRRPVELIYQEAVSSRSESLVREATIRRWPRRRKLELAARTGV